MTQTRYDDERGVECKCCGGVEDCDPQCNGYEPMTQTKQADKARRLPGRTCEGCGKPLGCVPIAGQGYWHPKCWRRRPAPVAVWECWTCAPGYGFQRPKDHPPMPLYSGALANGHRASGHDVREVKR